MHNVCFASLSNKIYQQTEENVEKNVEEGRLFFFEMRIDIHVLFSQIT